MQKNRFILALVILPGILFLALPGLTSAEVKLPISPISRPVSLTLNRDIDSKNLDTPADYTGNPVAHQPKSKTKAIFLSLLLPGAGHLYLGERGRGEVFMGGEAVSWAGFLAFRIYGSWKKNDYMRFAEDHAGIDPTGKDEEFYKNLTFYDSREDYNRSGRIIDPSGAYYPNSRTYYWQWDSDSSRDRYRDMRNTSKAAFRNATFMIGVAVVNRIVAGIDAFRLAKKLASRSMTEFGFNDGLKFDFKANPFGSNPKVKICISHRF